MQTSIEWLVKTLELDTRFNGVMNDVIEQAKQMEKEQIIKSNRDGVDMVVNKQPFITGEEYYKETYGS